MATGGARDNDVLGELERVAGGKRFPGQLLPRGSFQCDASAWSRYPILGAELSIDGQRSPLTAAVCREPARARTHSNGGAAAADGGRGAAAVYRVRGALAPMEAMDNPKLPGARVHLGAHRGHRITGAGEGGWQGLTLVGVWARE